MVSISSGVVLTVDNSPLENSYSLIYYPLQVNFRFHICQHVRQRNGFWVIGMRFSGHVSITWNPCALFANYSLGAGRIPEQPLAMNQRQSKSHVRQAGYSRCVGGMALELVVESIYWILAHARHGKFLGWGDDPCIMSLECTSVSS